ncbi:MAG: HNH endonuclease [Candidatus Marinimicrobia bacterium]|nr:HNH endonuclease [Candidatus Neomarinimicrobiota bacterium]MBL7109353.1 HNH endonuclease [Candidatus Neomarinimicrobiota bacterium]
MNYALYINGIFESVLTEIVTAQKNNDNLICYLQPYKSHKINWKNSVLPTEQNPITLYISTTDSLPIVTYKAKIVGWENKNEINEARREFLDNHIMKFQKGETEIYEKGVNLISIIELQKVQIPLSVQNFTKIDDNKPLKTRTRAGGWSYVNTLPNWVNESKESIFADDFNKSINSEIEESFKDSNETRENRLKTASKKPEIIQIIQRGFRRNPDVIITVLKRANGVCEKCNQNAPFKRAKDNSPYLEVHHKIMLSEDGEDTVDNAIAVCPNCHKELHYGVRNNEI